MAFTFMSSEKQAWAPTSVIHFWRTLMHCTVRRGFTLARGAIIVASRRPSLSRFITAFPAGSPWFMRFSIADETQNQFGALFAR